MTIYTAVQPLALREYRHTHCADCALYMVCLPPFVADHELPQLDAIIERGRPLSRNTNLFKQGQAFDQVYAVRSGAIKTTVTLPNGEEQITGFYLPGEIVGLDSIGNVHYENSAYALETTSVCAIPYVDLKSLGRLLPSLQDHLFNLMGSEIRKSQHVLLAISKYSAEERVVMFLLSLSARYKRRHLSEDQFRLPMTRSDIGNFLGLALETTSRVFTQLQHAGVLDVQGREIKVLDRPYLGQLIDSHQ